jgi:GNAT superfamily N-acetyltransferase
MGEERRAAYVDGFRDRLRAMRRPGHGSVDEPGIVGLIGRGPAARDGRVLVTDDRALPVLAARHEDLLAYVVYVFDDAEASRLLLDRSGRYRPNPCTAMVSEELGEIPEVSLPTGLHLARVATASGDEGVPLAGAASAAIRSDPDMSPTTDLDSFVGYLRSIPSTHFLAAVDDDGTVRATSASATWGPTAGVFFVNTDPDWRGQGVGTAMTAAALRVARAAGARRACLDASDLGLSIYLRLGFEPVGAITQFVDSRG